MALSGNDALALAKSYTKKALEGAGALKGQDGVSPTIEASKVDGVTTVTITDINGTRTIEINDGANGNDGEKGEKGEAGNDGEDGRGIQNIEFFSTTSIENPDMPGQAGCVDTYRILYTDGTEYLFDVYNGQDGSGTSTSDVDVRVTVSEYGIDDESFDVLSNPMYKTIAFAMQQASNAGVKNLLVNIEGYISESLSLVHHYDYVKFYREQEESIASVSIFVDTLDMGNNATVIFDIDNLDLSFSTMSDVDNSKITNFGKMVINGISEDFSQTTSNSVVHLYGDGALSVTNGSTLIVKNCEIDANTGYLEVTNGSRCALVDCTWSSSSVQQTGISVSDGGIFTANTVETQMYIKNSGTNTGMVFINNQYIPH